MRSPRIASPLSRYYLVDATFDPSPLASCSRFALPSLRPLPFAVKSLAGDMFPGNYGTFLDGFDTNGDGLIDFSEFMEINDKVGGRGEVVGSDGGDGLIDFSESMEINGDQWSGVHGLG